ncbi:endonuclease/exonuclease/phosphatase family protein [Pseudonocardia phyllosphaerae]|uniref:endonuclease/exonuclease/phosphatase family protein n=1 Tax=Pseudonocardia phyllosphaerae TaxID=3390502 RepID=UPI00397E7BF2
MRSRLVPAVLLAALAPALLGAVPASAAPPRPTDVRFATFNASLNRAAPGELRKDLSTPDDPQARLVADTIQEAHPDVLLINEFDHDPVAAEEFRKNYLATGDKPIEYPYVFTAPVNTGVPSGMDLDHDGKTDGPGDALGFGAFPGQYGMLVLSKYPIGDVRTFQHFLWKDLPGNRIPPGYYSPEALAKLPLSSKSHWDVPIGIGGRTVHLLASHPTPPTFDGPEDRNGRRNADEIGFWRRYVTPGPAAHALVDDKGRRGGIAPTERFVIEGDMNSDPVDGDSVPGAAGQILTAPRVIDPKPRSAGAAENATPGHRGDPALDTGDFAEPVPGNLRTDYVLPSFPLQVRDSAVLWAAASDPLARLNKASDHRMVRVDLQVR